MEASEDYQELARIMAVIGNHRRKSRELEALEELEVEVKVKETTDTVTLPNGKRVTSPRLGVGEVLWSPANDTVDDTDRREEKEYGAMERVRRVPRVDGVFVRQWGERGKGEGQFNTQFGVAVSGEEVFVCDQDNNRVQVFGLDGTYRRQWGERGQGEGQFRYPRGVAIGDDLQVFVSDIGNYRVQVFR